MENTESVTSHTAAAGLASARDSFGDAVYQFGKRRLELLEQQQAADCATTTDYSDNHSGRISTVHSSKQTAFSF